MRKIPTILIVDDDPDIGNMLKMMFEFKGYAVILLRVAGDTEAVLKNETVDLVILDMLIAGTKGTDVCARIRQSKIFNHLPVLMISALPDARQSCLQAGATDFISKPFEMNEIISKINTLISLQKAGL
jgi:two-component system alkaline phosphatase synthesis response regulator PhoP